MDHPNIVAVDGNHARAYVAWRAKDTNIRIASALAAQDRAYAVSQAQCSRSADVARRQRRLIAL